MQSERPFAWRLVLLLTLAGLFSMVDRQLLGLLVTPLKRDLGLSDIEVGLLQGLAFSLCYAFSAIPLGMLADRLTRKWIVVAGITAWSLLTATCGLARGFGTLFLARMGVGVGEATLSACGHSLIADAVRFRALPFALSLYGGGVALGAGGAYLLGGQALALFARLPGLGAAGPYGAPWRLAFLVVGLPGLLVALALALGVREPARSHFGPDGQPDAKAPPVSLGGFFRAHRRLALLVLGGVGSLTAAGFAALGWMPAFFERRYGWDTARAGIAVGTLLIAGQLPGGLLFGRLAERWIRAGRSDASMRLMALAALASAPLGAGAYLMSTPVGALLALAPAVAFGQCFIGLGPAVCQSVAPGALRSRLAAYYLLVTNLIGMATGPLVVALLTDRVFHDEARLGDALAIVVGAFTLLGALLLLAGLGAYRGALGERARPVGTDAERS